MDDLKYIQMGFSRNDFYLNTRVCHMFIPNLLSPIEWKHSHDHPTHLSGPGGHFEGHRGGVQQEINPKVFLDEPLLDVVHIIHKGLLLLFNDHGSVSL